MKTVKLLLSDGIENDNSGPQEPLDTALLKIEPNKGSLTNAKITLVTMDGHYRFRYPRQDESEFRGSFGERIWGSPHGDGCASFSHYLYQYLCVEETKLFGNDKSLLEPRCKADEQRSGIEEETGDEEGSEDSEDSGDQEDEQNEQDKDLLDNDGEPLEGSYEEIISPSMFYPRTDIFSVPSILHDALQYHCGCCIKESATTSPCRVTAPFNDTRRSMNRPSRTSFDDKEFMPFTRSTYPDYNDNVNRDLGEDNADPHVHYMGEAEEREYIYSGGNSRLIEAMILPGNKWTDEGKCTWSGARAVYDEYERATRESGKTPKSYSDMGRGPQVPFSFADSDESDGSDRSNGSQELDES